MADIVQISKCIDIEGMCRGVVFKTDENYIVKEKGVKGLKELETKLKEINCQLEYKNIRTMDFYPLSWRIASLLLIKEIFNFSDEKIKEMGMAAPKFSLVTKIFMKYFSSINRIIGQISSIWKRHYSIGELTVLKVDENAHVIILRLSGLSVHPVFYVYLSGYFSTIAQMVIGSAVLCRETEDGPENNGIHEYEITW